MHCRSVFWPTNSNSWLELGLSSSLWASLVIWSAEWALVTVTGPILPLLFGWHYSLASEATSSECQVIMLSSHLLLPWEATCPCCSLTRCTHSMLIRLGFSGCIDRGHLIVHESQNIWEEKVTKEPPEAPKGVAHLGLCRGKNAGICEGLTAKS